MGLVCWAVGRIRLKISESTQQKETYTTPSGSLQHSQLQWFFSINLWFWSGCIKSYRVGTMLCVYLILTFLSGEKNSSHYDQWGKDDIWTKRSQSQESFKKYLHFIIFSQWVARVIVLKWLLITILIRACNIFISVWWLFINLKRNIFTI